MKRSDAIKYRGAIVQAADSLPVEVAITVPELYQKWKSGEAFELNDLGEVPFVIRRYNDILYRLNLVHTTQDDWAPDLTPSLWVKYISPETIPEWNYDDWQSYLVGTKVIHNGIRYECINASFGWIEPGSQDGHYGWQEI